MHIFRHLTGMRHSLAYQDTRLRIVHYLSSIQASLLKRGDIFRNTVINFVPIHASGSYDLSVAKKKNHPKLTNNHKQDQWIHQKVLLQQPVWMRNISLLFFMVYMTCCVTSLPDVMSSDLWWCLYPPSHLLAAFKNAAVEMPAAKVDGTNRYHRQNRYFNSYKMRCNI